MKILATNKKAYGEYEILESLEAGIVLTGPEVKSSRRGSFNLKDSFCRFKAGEAFLVNSYIAPYVQASYNNLDPSRDRKLLLNRREILRWFSKVKEKGLTVIPLKVYLNPKGLVKAEIALAKGKRVHEKKDKIKEKVERRETDRFLKRGGRE